MSYGYAVTNLLSGLAASSFTFSTGLNDATRSRLNDARMSSRYVNGSPVTTLNLVIDFTVAVSPAGFAVCNSNCATQQTTTLAIESADNAAFTVNNVVRKAATTLTATDPYGKDHVLQFGAAGNPARRYWRLTWTWVGTVSNFSIGELWAFASTTLTRKSIYGGGESEEIFVAGVDYYNGGNRSYLQGGPLRTQQLPFSDLTLAERKEQATLWRATQGPAKSFIWIDNVEASATAAAAAEQQMIYGKLAVPAYSWREIDFSLFDPGELVIRSLSREVGA